MTGQARRVFIFGEYRAEVGMAMKRNASWMGQKGGGRILPAGVRSPRNLLTSARTSGQTSSVSCICCR